MSVMPDRGPGRHTPAEADRPVYRGPRKRPGGFMQRWLSRGERRGDTEETFVLNQAKGATHASRCAPFLGSNRDGVGQRSGSYMYFVLLILELRLVLTCDWDNARVHLCRAVPGHANLPESRFVVRGRRSGETGVGHGGIGVGAIRSQCGRLSCSSCWPLTRA